jgi:hypothetical protein
MDFKVLSEFVKRFPKILLRFYVTQVGSSRESNPLAVFQSDANTLPIIGFLKYAASAVRFNVREWNNHFLQ